MNEYEKYRRRTDTIDTRNLKRIFEQLKGREKTKEFSSTAECVNLSSPRMLSTAMLNTRNAYLPTYRMVYIRAANNTAE